MSVAVVLRAAKDAGLRLVAAGDRLKLQAPSRPPDAVLRLVDDAAAELLRLLQPDAYGWTAADWVALFDQRVAIEGSVPDAETKAFEYCIDEWLRHQSGPALVGDAPSYSSVAAYFMELGLTQSPPMAIGAPLGEQEAVPSCPLPDASPKSAERIAQSDDRKADDTFAGIMMQAQHYLRDGFTVYEMRLRLRDRRVEERILQMVDNGFLEELGDRRYRCAPRWRRPRPRRFR